MTQRLPASASELAMGRLAVMLQDLLHLKGQRYDRDDIADRGLVRALLADVRDALDELEGRLRLPPLERENDRRLRNLRRA